MAILSTSTDAVKKDNKTSTKQIVSSPAKRSKNPGVRVHGGRIYDPQNGRTCHQCRQKTMDFAASCKGMKGEKPCTINFCHKCLLNRYGEKAEEVSTLEVWSCPKCRGLCNCSYCMKKKGEAPTGILVHKAKLTGFSSVHELLNHGGESVETATRLADVSSPKKSPGRKMVHGAGSPKKSPGPKVVLDAVSPKKSPATKKGLGQLKRSRDKENCKVEENGAVIVGDDEVEEKCLVEEKQNKKPSKKLKQTTVGTESENAGVKKKLKVENQESGLLVQKDNEENLKDIAKEKDIANEKAAAKPRKLKGTSSRIIKESVEENGAVIVGDDGVKEKCLLEEKQNKKPSKRLKQTTIATECENAGVKKKLKVENQENGLLVQKDNDENLKDIAKEEDIAKEKAVAKPPKLKAMSSRIIKESVEEEVVRPQGKPLTVAAGVELPGEDVGPALQFLEFCKVFSKVLDIKKGEPEAIIRELVRGFSSQRRCRVTSAIIQFQIRLLSFILEDIGAESSLETKGENSWLKALGKCLNEDKHFSMEFPLDIVNDYSGYNNLNSSRKLRILLFLCDEVLGTEALRKFLDEENAKFTEEEKDRREHIIAAKKKERLIKQTLKDDFAKAMLSTQGDAQLSISEHEKFISKLRFETEKAHQEMLESIEHLPKSKQVPDAIRSSPLFIEKDGNVFWRLKSYERSSSIILQDIKNWNTITPEDKWFFFDKEEQPIVEKYISSLRSQKEREYKEYLKNALKGAAGLKEEDSLDNPKSPNNLVEVN